MVKAAMVGMTTVDAAYHMLLLGAMLILGVLIIVGIIRSVLGPGISDRIIAVNMIGTIIIMLIAILSLYLDENYLVDVCLIYAMISFLGVVVLCKVYTGVYLQKRNRKANLTAIQDNLERQADVHESGGEAADPAEKKARPEAAAPAENTFRAETADPAENTLRTEAGPACTGAAAKPDGSAEGKSAEGKENGCWCGNGFVLSSRRYFC